MKRDLKAAARIQQAFLPEAAPSAGTARFAWRYRPCDELASELANRFQEEEFGFERLQEVLCANRADSLQSSVDALVARVEAWCGDAGVADDVSVLAIEL